MAEDARRIGEQFAHMANSAAQSGLPEATHLKKLAIIFAEVLPPELRRAGIDKLPGICPDLDPVFSFPGLAQVRDVLMQKGKIFGPPTDDDLQRIITGQLDRIPHLGVLSRLFESKMNFDLDEALAILDFRLVHSTEGLGLIYKKFGLSEKQVQDRIRYAKLFLSLQLQTLPETPPGYMFDFPVKSPKGGDYTHGSGHNAAGNRGRIPAVTITDSSTSAEDEIFLPQAQLPEEYPSSKLAHEMESGHDTAEGSKATKILIQRRSGILVVIGRRHEGKVVNGSVKILWASNPQALFNALDKSSQYSDLERRYIQGEGRIAGVSTLFSGEIVPGVLCYILTSYPHRPCRFDEDFVTSPEGKTYQSSAGLKELLRGLEKSE